MPKTKELTIICSEATTKREDHYRIRVIIDEPDMNGLLSSIDWEDVCAFVQSESKNKPDVVFDDEYLEKWAEENGYTKTTES